VSGRFWLLFLKPAVDASACSALNQSSSGEPIGHPRDSHRVYATPAIGFGSTPLVTVFLRCNSEACLFDNAAVVDAISVISLRAKFVGTCSKCPGRASYFARLVIRQNDWRGQVTPYALLAMPDRYMRCGVLCRSDVALYLAWRCPSLLSVPTLHGSTSRRGQEYQRHCTRFYR
jgi:hypothetical protein